MPSLMNGYHHEGTRLTTSLDEPISATDAQNDDSSSFEDVAYFVGRRNGSSTEVEDGTRRKKNRGTIVSRRSLSSRIVRASSTWFQRFPTCVSKREIFGTDGLSRTPFYLIKRLEPILFVSRMGKHELDLVHPAFGERVHAQISRTARDAFRCR